MFMKASRLKLRFDTSKGLASVEDLWDIQLTSNTGRPNLNDIAKGLFKELKETEEPDFVENVKKKDEISQLKFDIVKYIIDVKKSENEVKAKAQARKEEVQQLMEIIARKQNAALEGAPLEELMTKLRTLQNGDAS